MKEKLQKIRENAIAQIREAKNLNTLNDARVAILGKKGELTSVLKSMKDVAPEDRPKVGQLVNETREEIEKVLDQLIPRKPLREYGMTEDQIDTFTDSTLENQQRLLANNYVSLDRSEIHEIFAKLR